MWVWENLVCVIVCINNAFHFVGILAGLGFFFFFLFCLYIDFRVHVICLKSIYEQKKKKKIGEIFQTLPSSSSRPLHVSIRGFWIFLPPKSYYFTGPFLSLVYFIFDILINSYDYSNMFLIKKKQLLNNS